MKYLIRLFIYGEDEGFTEYNFDHLPYMPRIGETLDVYDTPYIVTEIQSSFDQLNDGQFMIDYTIREVMY